MKSVDYIIVGDGYAALFFAHHLIKNNKTFILYSSGEKSASQVSAGIINPVVLKKFTTFWKAQEQITNLEKILKEMEGYLAKSFLVKEPIHRVFHDEKEKELWRTKTEANEELKPFLNPEFSVLDKIKNPYGVGEVWQSARLDVDTFFTTFFEYLTQREMLILEKFDYQNLNPGVSIYQGVKYQNIVFAEGVGVLDNPFFSQIAISPNKGHYIQVKLSESLPRPLTIKKKHFFFQLKSDTYYYGGTYDRHRSEPVIDTPAVEQLKAGLEEFYPYTYDIKQILYGFRPTVKDRRPLLGAHSIYKNLYVFNGLGARGILNASYFAEILYRFIETKEPLPSEVNWQRF